VRYHEEFEKKIKGSKIEVVDDPESKRLKRLGSLVSQVEYKKSTDLDARRRASLTHNRTCHSTVYVGSSLNLNFNLLY